MDCNRIQDRLVDYLTEETRVTERLCVEVHLATCYHCREAMEDVRAVLDDARNAIRYVGPERSFDAAMNEIHTREALLTTGDGVAQQSTHRWSWGIAVSALPIVIACITPFVVARPSPHFPKPSGDLVDLVSTFRIPFFFHAASTLPQAEPATGDARTHSLLSVPLRVDRENETQ